jgi:hypothetical protein
LRCSWYLWLAFDIWHFWFCLSSTIAFCILISDVHEWVNLVTVYSTSISLISQTGFHILARCRTWGQVLNINYYNGRTP